MAMDEPLNDRIRQILKGNRDITERKMFGGLCFMHHGNMLCGADDKHGLMVRVGPEQYDAVLKLKHAREMLFTGKPMRGLVTIEPDGYKTRASLAKWIERGKLFTSALPKK